MHEKLISTIQEILKPKKPLVAIKAWKKIPKDIPAYEDKSFPGTCSQVCEVIETGKTFYSQTKNTYCTGGVLATGVLKPLSEKQSRKIVEMHLSIFVLKKPVSTYSDIAWRKFTKMSDDELTMSFPYDCLVKTVEDLPLIAEHYEHYGEGMDI